MKCSNNLSKSFIKSFFILSLISSVLIVGFNFIIDPFNLHQTVSFAKVNQIKTEVEKQCRLYKALDIAKQKPKAILLGTSRVMGGLDPDDLKMLIQLPVYNAGAAGASFEEIYRYFEHALYHQPHLKVVVLGIDFFAFSQVKKFENELDSNRLQFLPHLTWKDLYASLFTKNALIGSYQTVKKNALNQAETIFFPNGQYNPHLLANEHNPLLSGGDLDFIKRMFNSSMLYRRFQLDDSKIQLFKKMVKICQEKGIRLTVFFCPSKAVYWEALCRKGLGQQLNALKRQLSASQPIWDFSGFNSITTQEIEKSDHPFYFECSHFTPHLGKQLIEKMFNSTASQLDCGFLLTSTSCQTGIDLFEQQRTKWIIKHPELVQQIEQALSDL